MLLPIANILYSSKFCHGLTDILGVKGVYTSTVIKGAAQFLRQYVSVLAPRYAYCFCKQTGIWCVYKIKVH
jgi:hypothetical protein